MTTIVSVRRNNVVAVGGDGQVTMGQTTILKGNAIKVRKVFHDRVIAGFAGSTADAFTLLDLFEQKLEEHQGILERACITLAKLWRSDRALRKLEAILIVADKTASFLITGTGDVVRMDDDTVTFLVKDYRNEGQWKELTISGVEFVRRFLMHVPPRRFVRIRHYGLLCSRTKNQKLTLCRNLLGCKKYLSKLRDMEMPEILEHLYGIKVCVCKACGGHLGKPQMRMPLRC